MVDWIQMLHRIDGLGRCTGQKQWAKTMGKKTGQKNWTKNWTKTLVKLTGQKHFENMH